MFPWYRTNIYHLEAYLNSPWKFPSMHSFFQHLAIYAGGFSDLQCLIPAIPQVFLGQFPMFEGFFPKKAHVFWSHFGEKHVLIPLFFSNSVLLGVRYLAFLCHMCDPVPQKHVLFPPTVWGLRWCNFFGVFHEINRVHVHVIWLHGIFVITLYCITQTTFGQ